MVLITLAGTPPTIQLSSIPFVTTAPAAMTTLFSPILYAYNYIDRNQRSSLLTINEIILSLIS